MISKKIKKCRISDDKNLILVSKFPNLALTGTFLRKEEKAIKTPMEIVFSKKSKLLQLNHNYNSNILYGKNYGYRSGLNPVMVKHLKDKSQYLKKIIKLNKNTKILDIGSNDSTFLNFFKKSVKYGVDPTIIKYKKFYSKKINIIPKTFQNGFLELKSFKFKLITSVAMFYDLEDPVDFLLKAKNILESDGIIHIEVAYLPAIIKKFSYDTFCQEHYEYYSLISLNYLISKVGMKIVDIGFNDINGGSIWINISHLNSKYKPYIKKINKFLILEKKLNIHKVSTYKLYFKNVFEHSKKLKKIIKNLRENKKEIYGYGASTKGNVLLQLSKLNNKDVKKIFDVNNYKFRKFTPISKIEIIDEKKLRNFKIDYLLILIWHFKSYVIKKIRKKNNNIKIIVPFPKIRII
jgi:hypothetical protein